MPVPTQAALPVGTTIGRPFRCFAGNASCTERTPHHRDLGASPQGEASFLSLPRRGQRSERCQWQMKRGELRPKQGVEGAKRRATTMFRDGEGVATKEGRMRWTNCSNRYRTRGVCNNAGFVILRAAKDLPALSRSFVTSFLRMTRRGPRKTVGTTIGRPFRCCGGRAISISLRFIT